MRDKSVPRTKAFLYIAAACFAGVVLLLPGCRKDRRLTGQCRLTIVILPHNEAATKNALVRIRSEATDRIIAEKGVFGRRTFSLPPGEYLIDVDKGPGYSQINRYVRIRTAEQTVEITPAPWMDLRKLGWQVIKPFRNVTALAPEDLDEFLEKEAAVGTDFLGLSSNWKLHGDRVFGALRDAWEPRGLGLVMARMLGRGPYYGVTWAYTSAPAGRGHGPLYPDMQTVRDRGGICAFQSPANDAFEGISRFSDTGFAAENRRFRSAGIIRAGLGAELPFDLVAGPLFSLLDIDLRLEKDLRLWFFILNKGYRIPAVSSRKDPRAWCLAPDTVYGRRAVQKGVTCISNGPVLFFRIANVLPGGTLPDDGRRLQGHVGAFLDPAGDEYFTSLTIIRNGRPREYPVAYGQRTVDLSVRPIFEDQPAWYAARVETSRGRSAVTNPVYFGKETKASPPPATARPKITVIDAQGRPVANAAIRILDQGKRYRKISYSGKPVETECPPTSEVIVTAEGYAPDRRTIFEASGVRDYLLDLHSASSEGAEALQEWGTYEHVRLLLSVARITFQLQKSGAASGNSPEKETNPEEEP